MRTRQLFNIIFAVLLLFLFTHSVWSQESGQTKKQKKSSAKRLMWKLSDQDIILPITSIEWGTPDRWSITSRYIHKFEKDKKRRTWYNSIGVSVSPGISGGRLGIGYQGILHPKSMRDFGLISEARVVLLRTWGNPLVTETNQTFIGAEIRSSLSALINVGSGYYKRISDTENHRDHFYGFHIGVGF